MGYFGIRTLTISPGACPWPTTRLHFCRRRWSCPEGASFPSWTLRPPQLGRPSFSCLPRLEGEHLLLPPRLQGRSVPQSHRTTMSPITPGVGNSFGFPWPSWSSPAPRKEPESASPSGERPQCLRAEGPNNQSAPMPPPSPVKGMGAQTPHMVKLWEINTLPDVQNLPDSQGASRLVRGPR